MLIVVFRRVCRSHALNNEIAAREFSDSRPKNTSNKRCCKNSRFLQVKQKSELCSCHKMFTREYNVGELNRQCDIMQKIRDILTAN